MSKGCWKENNTRTHDVAHPNLSQINGCIVGDFSMLLSNNHHMGRTCFADSGGANSLGDSNGVAGIYYTLGLNGSRAGNGSVFCTDRHAQDFVNGYLNP